MEEILYTPNTILERGHENNTKENSMKILRV